MNRSRLVQEIRGVMTQFEVLTREAVAAAGDGLTYEEVSDILSAHGLDIRKVVYDPNRKIFGAYYADYELGQYAAMVLQRDYLHGAGHLEFRKLENYGGVCPRLLQRDWKNYYFRDVPLPMAIYDFGRRYRDIPKEQVFSVWHRIYKHIDYGTGMWPPEVLDYVLRNAPPPDKLPKADPDGIITLYRGMGERSLPPERAISWSSHPGNALWFAIRAGEGGCVATTRAKPEQIVAYFGTYADENEVLVLPGTVQEYRVERMIPASAETVPWMIVPVLRDYQHYGRMAKELGYMLEGNPFQVHGLKHILRVLLLSLLYAQHSGDDLSEADRQILIYFALLHDIGRVDDGRDDHHGERTVAMIQQKNIRLPGIQLRRLEYQVAHMIIANHCRDDAVGEAAFGAAKWLSRRERARAIHLYQICKDMDGLDRVRFNGLDYRMLRTEYAKQMPLIAGELLEEDLLAVLETEI